MKRQIRSKGKLQNIIIAFYLSVIGVAVLVFGTITGIENISSAQNDKRLIAEGISTVGEIVDVKFKTIRGRGGSSNKIFTVEYTDRNGQRQSLTESEVFRASEEGSTQNVANDWLHKKVNVFYDATDTSNSVVEDWPDSISMAVFGLVFLGLTGSALIAFGAITARSVLRESRNKS